MRFATILLLALALPAVARAEGPGDAAARDIDGNPYLPGTQVPIRPGGNPPHGGGPLVFDDQAAFLAAAGPVTTETFEDEPHSGDCDTGALPVLSVTDFTATSNPAALKILRDACFGNHNTTPGGVKYLTADTDVALVSADVMFVFNEPLTAMGLWLVDLDSALLEVVIQGVGYPVLPHGDGGQSYFGIVSAVPFADATFRIVNGTDTHYSFDDVAYGLSGPVAVEPAGWGRVKAEWRE
jgi:hypothetical protein